MKSISFTPPPASAVGRSMAEFGYPSVEVGIHVAATYDAAKKTYTIDDYSIVSPKAGTLKIVGVAGNLDAALFSGARDDKVAAAKQSSLLSAAVSYTDGGLFDKAVAFMARQQKKQPADLKREWSAMATQFIPMMLGGDPASLKIAEALSKFIASPSSLTVTARAKGNAPKFMDLGNIKAPQQLFSIFDISASAGR